MVPHKVKHQVNSPALDRLTRELGQALVRQMFFEFDAAQANLTGTPAEAARCSTEAPGS
jgi:hypothetical protein